MSCLCKLSGHRWADCKCVRCGEVRDEAHDWNGCTCKVCGKTRDREHRFRGGRCEVCGKTLNAARMAEDIRGRYAEWKVENRRSRGYVNRREADEFAFGLVSQAQCALEKHEADVVLLAWLQALAFDGSLMARRLSSLDKPVEKRPLAVELHTPIPV